MSARRHVTNERALCNLTTSIRLLPDGRAVCFGAAGPKIVGAQLARILSDFSAPTSPRVLLRCGGAAGPFLSATGLDARRLGKPSRALLQVYGRLRRQTAGYLIEDAVRDRLVEPAAAPRDASVQAAPVIVSPSRCGDELRRELRERLTAAVRGREREIDYCLSHGRQADAGGGSVRNLGLLMTAGSSMVWVEEPILAEARLSADAPGPPTEAVDLFASFRQNLGRRLADLPDTLSPAAKPSPDTLDWWQRYRADSWVAVVQPGYLAQAGASRRRQPQLVKTGKPALVRPPASIALTLVGLDNRKLLPPFPPCIAACDRVWGWLVGLMHPSAVILELPFTVVRGAATLWGPDRDESVQPEDILLQLLRSYSLPSAISDPETRLTLLGRYLVSCGRMSTAALRDLAVSHALRSLALASRCTLTAHDRETDSFPTGALRPIPGGAWEDRLSGARETLMHFGNLLVAWPDIWRAAASSAEARS